MIISREYVTFRRLVDGGDPAGKLFMDLFRRSYPEDRWDEIYQALADQCLYQREMGWAFTEICALLEGFEKLDNEQPYDNGFTFDDVWEGEVLWQDENAVSMLLINKAWGTKSIVKVVEINNDTGNS